VHAAGLWWVQAGDPEEAGPTAASGGGSTFELTLDPAGVDVESLVVRGRLPGDRIDPAGLGGRHRKLQDVFVDAKIPRVVRDVYPVVCDAEGPLWIPGLAAACRAGDGLESAVVLTAWLADDLLSPSATSPSASGGRRSL